MRSGHEDLYSLMKGRKNAGTLKSSAWKRQIIAAGNGGVTGKKCCTALSWNHAEISEQYFVRSEITVEYDGKIRDALMQSAFSV
jgi:hypothetical protein